MAVKYKKRVGRLVRQKHEVGPTPSTRTRYVYSHIRVLAMAAALLRWHVFVQGFSISPCSRSMLLSKYVARTS